jgi:uncharacterized membrane protein YeiH
MTGSDAASKQRIARLLFPIDLAGTFVFAVEGAMAAIAGGLDLLGVMVLAFATALGGGIVRDLLIGAAPPASIRDWRYPTTAFLGAFAAFLFHGAVATVPGDLLVVLDAGGLSLFAVAGALKARGYGLHAIVAVMMGTITGCGGGTIRDMLLAQVPGVLRTDVYASAAAVGALVAILAPRLRFNPAASAIAGALVCFVLRLAGHWLHWSLPHALS